MAVIAKMRSEIQAASRSSASNARTQTFPSVGALHPPAIRLERAIHSLFGLRTGWRAGCAALARSRLLGRAISARSRACRRRSRAAAYDFLPVEGESLHQIPVGPVHAGIIEPGHFRFTASGETVVRLEERLGYVHKGIESLMAGATIERAAKLAARTSGDSTVAYGIAFAHAVEAALRRRGAAAGALFARADGGTRAAGESFRRHRRHLQRCVVRASCTRIAASCASRCCARPMPVSATA